MIDALWYETQILDTMCHRACPFPRYPHTALRRVCNATDSYHISQTNSQLLTHRVCMSIFVDPYVGERKSPRADGLA